MNPNLLRSLMVALMGLALHLVLWLPFPALAQHSLRNWIVGIGQVLVIVPSVLVLLGLFNVWVPKEQVARNLGRDSGARGVLLALLLGTGAAGPIYAAFPIGVTLLEKGARVANLVIFLGAWATIKLPMLLMESAYLGTRFALLRLALTLPGLIACGFLMEALLRDRALDPALSPAD
ncbi:MAG TPA: permease [Holophagaceae bacterium]|nr:permease [Holophagaceae bacterium]